MQHMDPAKTLSFKIAQRSAQLLRLLAHDMGTESALWAITVSLVAKLLRQIKSNSNRNAMILAGQGNDCLASFGLHVRGINYDELASGQPFGSDEIQNLKSVVCGRLAVLIVGYQTTAEVR